MQVLVRLLAAYQDRVARLMRIVKARTCGSLGVCERLSDYHHVGMQLPGRLFVYAATEMACTGAVIRLETESRGEQQLGEDLAFALVINLVVAWVMSCIGYK